MGISRRSLIVAAPALILPRVAISRPRRGLFPPLPSEVTSLGFNTVTKFDHFDDPSTVDINNTQASGFNWYMQSYGAGSTYANPAPPWLALSPSDISISNSVLEIKNDVSGFSEGLVSTVDNNVPFAMRAGPPYPGDADGPFYAVDPNAWKGWAFKNGAHVDFSFKFDPAPLQTPQSEWNSVWTQPQSFVSGGDEQCADCTESGSPVPPQFNNRIYTELDFFEAILWDNPCMALNAWSNLRPSDGGPSFTTSSTAFNAIPGVVWSNWNTVGCFWCPASANGGTGFVHRYLNGVHLPAFDVTWTPGDMFSNLDNQINYMILGATTFNPTYFDWVRVTQRSMSDIVIQ